MHVGESSKMKGGRQGTLSDSRYPPLSKNSSSDFRISTTSRLSFVIWRPSSSIRYFFERGKAAALTLPFQQERSAPGMQPGRPRDMQLGRGGGRPSASRRASQ